MKFKVGDKVRVREDLVVNKRYDGYLFSKFMEGYKGKIFTIKDVDDDSYELREANYWWTDEMLEEAKEDKMEKTFREVIRDIKEGEVWENSGNRIERIFINEQGNIQFTGNETFSINYSTCVNPDTLYKLQRKEYTFCEAFEAYEKGKEIEDRSRVKYKKINGVDHYKLDYASNFCTRADEDDYWLGFKEIRGKWYINE